MYSHESGSNMIFIKRPSPAGTALPGASRALWVAHWNALQNVLRIAPEAVHRIPQQIAPQIAPRIGRRIALWTAPCIAQCLLLLLLWAAGPLGAVAQEAPQRLPAITLNAGMHNIRAEVAQTPQQRAIGLMHRREMPMHEGMLFVFEQAGTQCFWMKNTLLPLSIAYLEDDGTVVNIADMQPESLESHCSARPVRHALEMNQGWFKRRGVKAGDRITGPPFAARR
jgi:uncharacterized membrane protein (UPF0127 family)